MVFRRSLILKGWALAIPAALRSPRLPALIVHMKTSQHAQAWRERRRADVSAPASSTACVLPQALQEFARSASSTTHDHRRLQASY